MAWVIVKGVFIAAAGLVLAAAQPARAAACEDLASLKITDVTIVTAVPVAPGFTVSSALSRGVTIPQPFCRIIGFATSVAGSKVGFEVWLPPADAWNRGGQPPPPGPNDGVMNTLHLTLYHGVTAEQMAGLRAIAGDTGNGDLHAFGTQFRVMARPGEHSFDIDPKDEREVLTQIRTGKQASDIMITNMHWHQNRYDFQAYSYDHFPADFEIKFAHDAIDQGDDVFVAQGVHTIKGVEIYKGKPIFYGTSNFIFQNAIMPEGKGHLPGEQPAREGRGGRGGEPPQAPAPAADSPIVGEHEVQGFWQLKPNMEAIMGQSFFDKGRLVEVRIYPVDLGQTLRTGTKYGVPTKPAPEVAQKVLDEVIEYSRPFGTHIEVKDGVGIIRVAEK